MGIMQLIRGIW